MSGPDMQIFWSDEQGWYFIEPDSDAVWEMDVSGYRVDALPEDAIELAPADPVMAQALHGRIASDANLLELLKADNEHLRTLLAEIRNEKAA